MAQVTHGTVTVTMPDSIPLPAQAGKLSKDDMKQMPPPPRIVGKVCIQAADAIASAGVAFSPPPGVTEQSLRLAGECVDGLDKHMIDMAVIRRRLQQANRIIGTEAWKQVRQMNDAIKAQMKHDPALELIFRRVLDAFAVFGNGGGQQAEEPEEDEDEGAEPEEPAPPA